MSSDLLESVYKGYVCTVTWEFESEAELLHLAQLKTLLDQYSPVVNLSVPYLPYARQDKWVSNGATFALASFAVLLNALRFAEVRAVDVHNNQRAHAIDNLVDVSPKSFIEDALHDTKADYILLPDMGAYDRYFAYGLQKAIVAEKVRDQSTGAILSVRFSGAFKKKTILIVDDLCDGGGTFKPIAEQASKAGARAIHLYVTHGLFTKGLQTLRDSGISRIFTRKGEVK